MGIILKRNIQVRPTRPTRRTIAMMAAKSISILLIALNLSNLICCLPHRQDCLVPHGVASCECINPFEGTTKHYRGDPESLCSNFGPGFCYVACNGECRDEKPTASWRRCQSSLACKVYTGQFLEFSSPR